MNDIGYLKLPFEGSECEASIKTARREGLINLLSACEGAVEYHTEEKNPHQIQFFQSGIDLINKRLKLKSVV